MTINDPRAKIFEPGATSKTDAFEESWSPDEVAFLPIKAFRAAIHLARAIEHELAGERGRHEGSKDIIRQLERVNGGPHECPNCGCKFVESVLGVKP